MKRKKLLLLFICFVSIKNLIAQNKKSSYKNKFSAGINISNSYIVGDIKPNKSRFGGGINVYKPLAKWFGLKFNYNLSSPNGISPLYSENFYKNTAWNSTYAAPYRIANGSIKYGYNIDGTFVEAPKQDVVYYNYKTQLHTFSLSAQLSLGLPFRNPFIHLHGYFGGGIYSYKTKINAKDGNNTYTNLFSEVKNKHQSGTYKNLREVITDLKNRMDNTYETDAESDKGKSKFSQNFGIGISYTYKKKYTIGIETTKTFVKTDLLDGQRWMEHAYGDAILSNSFDAIKYNSIYINYNF